MGTLDDILDSTRRRIAEAKQRVSQDVLEQRFSAAEPPRGFARALRDDGISVIAEIKRATPSAGELDKDLNASDQARVYADGGAAAVSVLTEPSSSGGRSTTSSRPNPRGFRFCARTSSSTSSK